MKRNLVSGIKANHWVVWQEYGFTGMPGPCKMQFIASTTGTIELPGYAKYYGQYITKPFLPSPFFPKNWFVQGRM